VVPRGLGGPGNQGDRFRYKKPARFGQQKQEMIKDVQEHGLFRGPRGFQKIGQVKIKNNV